MSILNQSITPNRQPVFPFKGSGSQDVVQHVPMALPLHGTQSKSFQPSSSNRTLSAIATGESSPGGSFCGVPADGFKSQSQTGMLEGSINGICNHSEFDPWALNFSRSLMEDEKLNLLKDGIGELDCAASRQNDVLVVTISSAMTLDCKQIDLISRKMQRLTGFRNLRLENIIDPSLIAGFVISYGSDGSHDIDLSVKGQLAALAARVECWDQRITSHGQC